MRSFLRMAPVLASLLLWGSGCSPPTEEQLAYEAARQSETQRRAELERSLRGASEESAVLALVKGTPAPAEGRTTEQWIQDQLDAQPGTVLYPRWEAVRRNIGRYEVRFTYTLMDTEGMVHKKGYAWNADLVLKVVGSPRALEGVEAEERRDRYLRRQRRVSHPEPLNVE